ncbi:MAG: hypothetical protein O7F12_01735 [Nitrospirae bacterium]|nr:hypothetical protein [Nitrospirota bacterium]
MPSTKTWLPSQSTTQRGDSSARLSVAMMELDQLIIRVSQIGTLPDQSMADAPRLRVASKGYCQFNCRRAQ